MTSWQWQRIKVANERTETIIHHLAIVVHPRNAKDIAQRLVLVNSMQQFNDSGLGLTTHNNDALVGKALLYKVRRARAHQYHPCLRAHLQQRVNCEHVALYRQVHCPYAINVAVVAAKELSIILFVFLVENKVLIGHFSKFLGLDNSYDCEFIYIWRKIHHPCASRRALGRSLSIKNWWHQESNLHILFSGCIFQIKCNSKNTFYI